MALEAHPGLADRAPGGAGGDRRRLASIENLLGLLVAGGIAPQEAAWACDILMLIVTATASEADVRRASGQTFDDDFVERMRTTFAGCPPSATRTSSATPPSWSPATATTASASRSTPSSTASSPAPAAPSRRPPRVRALRKAGRTSAGAERGEEPAQALGVGRIGHGRRSIARIARCAAAWRFLPAW